MITEPAHAPPQEVGRALCSTRRVASGPLDSRESLLRFWPLCGQADPESYHSHCLHALVCKAEHPGEHKLVRDAMAVTALVLDNDGAGATSTCNEVAVTTLPSSRRASIPVAVVTNQPGVARGLYGIDDVARVHEYKTERPKEHGAHIDLLLYCPYHPAGVVRGSARPTEDLKPNVAATTHVRL
jgi:hypothetical protein